jgi:class 3 adenylate cyclase
MATVDSGTLAAGRTAFERHDWEQAYDLFSAADAESRLEAPDLERLAEAAQWSRRFDDMFSLLERAEAGYRAAGESRSAGRVALKLAREYFARQNEALTGGWFGRAFTLLQDDQESHEGGMLLWMRAYATLFGQGDVNEALKLSEQLVELGRKLGDPGLEALGLLERGHGLIISGRVEEGVQLMDQANAIAGSEPVAFEVTGTVYCSTIFACRNIGDWKRASAWTDRSLMWCEQNSISGFPGLCRFHRAEVVRARGAFEEAERDARAACEELLLARPQMAGHAFHELGEVLRRRGDLDGARGAFARALDLGFDPQPGLALLRLEEGDAAGALRASFRRLADRDALTQESRALLLPAQVTIALAAGEPEPAAKAVSELEEAAEKCATPITNTSLTQARGELALFEGRLEDAMRELRAAYRGWCDAGWPYESAQVRALLGRAYRETGDLEAAIAELEGAHEVFARLGASTQARRVKAMLADLPRESDARETRTFMFTDIVDSSRLVELLGDESWALLLAWHDRTLRTCFVAHRGREIKHEGDGFFVAFPTVDNALRCAREVQRSLSQHRREHGFSPQIRIGVHTAEATVRGGDYIGRGVHAAARVASAGDAGEIVVSADALAEAEDEYDVAEQRPVVLKGFSEPVELARVSWR